MAETIWTDEQLSAINTRDKTLLVSAAAGSGKTATLTERIIRSLLDEENPMDIDAMLIVTYTKAAAAELRAKISRALSRAVEQNPDNAHLKRQLYLLPSAKIRTIDSYCNEILRANCDRIGLSPNYRIADTAECQLLAISIIEGLITAAYNGDLNDVVTAEEFEALADCLTDSKRTEDLSEILRYIHYRCECTEEGIDLLKKLSDIYSDGGAAVESNIYGKFLMDRLYSMLDHYIAAYKRYRITFSSGTDSEQKYLNNLEGDFDILMSIRNANGYEGAKAALDSFSLVRLASVSNALKTPDMENFAKLRTMMSKDVKGIMPLFTYTTEMWHDLFVSLGRLTDVLYRFEKKFDTVFAEEKRRHGALSYADIERYTYICLLENGKPTDIARNVAAQFDAIYIDEYQDVNSLQNRIFEAISKPNNRFMVGDIKQSIYGFRAARPEIFAGMKKAFPSLGEAKGDEASIFMSRNFRCDKGVVDFVNDIFDKAFGFVAESIGYVDGDRLGYAKKQPQGEPEYRYPTLCMVDKVATGEDRREPIVVAAKIAELLESGTLNDGSPIRPSDIAIILRDAKGKDVRYASALADIGIPCAISGAKDFFLSPEVLLALCLLNSLDNPRRDIYLGGLMCSPLFNFTADELYLIRSMDGETLYESLVNYVKCNEWFTKGDDFLKKLAYYREISEGVGVDILIHKLYRETGLMTLASRTGGRDNLTLLYDYARSYEAGSFKGLYNFISFINEIIDDKKTFFDDSRAETGVDAVKIVTSHGSKGLEYPIVFMVETSKLINNKEAKNRMAFNEDFGIAFRLRTPSGLALAKNPVRDIINLYIERKLYEEELRVLYVALTRARERLYMVGTCSTVKRDEYEVKLDSIRDNLSEYSFRELSSYMEIASVCLGKNPVGEDEFVENLPDVVEETTEYEEIQEISEINEELCDELTARFSFEYSKKHMTTLPEKMSVSLMSPTILDGTDGESLYIGIKDDAPESLPAFASGGGAEESAKRGIATHLFMQFLSLENLKENGASAELDRLYSSGFISAEDKERVRLSEIELFRKSDLFSRMLDAKKIHRELRFNVLLPATEFTKDEEKLYAYRDKEILVQGVIDCIIEGQDGSLTLCDYKTDRLTREELSDRTLAEEKLRNKHSMQLGLYSMAIEKIFGKKPSVVEIYSLVLGDTVRII